MINSKWFERTFLIVSGLFLAMLILGMNFVGGYLFLLMLDELQIFS